MSLRRGVRVRVLLVGLAVGVIGALTGGLGGLIVHGRTMQLMFQRNWDLHGRAQMLPTCVEANGDWTQSDSDGVTFWAYDRADGASRFDGAPALDPTLLARLEADDEAALQFINDEYWGGEALFFGTDQGACSLVLTRWPRRDNVRDYVLGTAGAGLVATVLATLLMVGFFVLRPLGRRVVLLRKAAGTVGTETYEAAAVGGDDDLGAIARSIERAHRRVVDDRETILGHRSAMEHFVADVAHDLRTPITSLQLALETLADKQLEPEDREALRGALSDVVYVASLTRNLQLASRLADGWDPLEVDSTIDLTEIARRVGAREKIFARRRGMSFEANINGGAVVIRGDATMTEQAISNLVQNAIIHGDEGGNVWLSLDTTDHRFTLRVEDDGPGVAPEELPHLGDRTFRSDEARQRDPKGSGLGLAIVREAAERSDWQVTFQTREPRGLAVQLTGERLL